MAASHPTTQFGRQSLSVSRRTVSIQSDNSNFLDDDGREGDEDNEGRLDDVFFFFPQTV